MNKLKKAVWWNFVIYMLLYNLGMLVIDLIIFPTYEWWYPLPTLVISLVTYPFLRRLWSK